MLLLAPLTLGVSVVILAIMHFAESPGAVWVEKGILKSSSKLPEEGVPVDAVIPAVVMQSLFFAGVNRYVKLNFADHKGKNRYLALNEIYYGKDQIDLLMQEFVIKKYAYLLPAARQQRNQAT